ncbi:hypothetical protein JCM8547_003743 [Rhodosporidiobolus lusitaniae]
MSRSKSRSGHGRRTARPSQPSPSLSAGLSLPPSPALTPSVSSSSSHSSTSLLPPASLPPLSSSTPSSSFPSSCPQPRGSTLSRPPQPPSPTLSSIAVQVLVTGETLAVASHSPFPSPLPSPMSSPPRTAQGGWRHPYEADQDLPNGYEVCGGREGREGRDGRRCVSASPPSLLPPIHGMGRPSLPRGRESAPSPGSFGGNSRAGSRARGSSSTSFTSTGGSTPRPVEEGGKEEKRRRKRRTPGSSSVSSSFSTSAAPRTPLSSSPVAVERPTFQTYTSFEEQFGWSAPPSPPASPRPQELDGGEGGEGKKEGSGRWWSL